MQIILVLYMSDHHLVMCCLAPIPWLPCCHKNVGTIDQSIWLKFKLCTNDTPGKFTRLAVFDEMMKSRNEMTKSLSDNTGSIW